MLQEATKVLSQAFKDSFIKKLSMYLHDCVSEEIRSSSFTNLNQDKGNKWFFLQDESILSINPDKPLKITNPDSRIAELMVQAEVSKKDYQLIFGYLFLKGKSSSRKKNEDFLTPLLYVPCRLERDGLAINCFIQDEFFSLNTSALVSLMEFDEEDETAEHLLEGLIDYIPEMPLNEEKIKIFASTLKAILPDVEVSHIIDSENKPINPEVFLGQTLENITLVDTSAVILTKRPNVLAGLLHELSEISEKPSGVFRETALSPIHDEFIGNLKPQKNDKKIEKVTKTIIAPLELSETQEQVIDGLNTNTLITVFGPPGTGKSQTIVNIASHLVGSGKTVLIASKMDKAVDVVSERLNSFGAKFICLRAGKTDYQKQLSFKLQDLISNKIDLDSGFESSVLTETEDINTVIKNKEDLENKCVKTLELESEWFKVFTEYEAFLSQQTTERCLNSGISLPDINMAEKILDTLENLYGKSGVISYIQFQSLSLLIKNRLKLGKIIINPEVMNNLRLELQCLKLKDKLREIETNITRTGSIHHIFENLKDLRGKYKITSCEILRNKRRSALKDIVKDQYKRQRLIIHSKALIERKKSLQNKIILTEDFKPMLDAFPCWAITNQVVSESLPLEPGLFDVAIIDESSQCDIAGCIPILFRAKKAIIVGDDRQLPHLSFLEKAKEHSFMNKYQIPERYQLMWRFRTNSMFDVANYYATSSILLDEHFRSYPEIIDFSNKEFYGNRMKVMKRKPASLKNESPVELYVVENAKVDLDSTKNMAEVEKIMDKLLEIIEKDSVENPEKPTSIGIISPFRGQVELIKKAINQVLKIETVKKHDIEVGTAHTFQGDERDIIILSFTLAMNSHYQSIAFVQKPNLFNVAVTRARKKLLCFISRTPESVPPGLLRDYLEYIEGVNKFVQSGIIPEIKDPIKKEISEMLKTESIEALSDIEIGGFPVYLLLSFNNKTLILETEGFTPKNESILRETVNKHQVLERCGWKVSYITAREWVYSKKAVIARIKETF